eukprot:6317928-Prymnesium_polylepis.1
MSFPTITERARALFIRVRQKKRGGRPDDALTRHPEQCKRPRHLQAVVCHPLGGLAWSAGIGAARERWHCAAAYRKHVREAPAVGHTALRRVARHKAAVFELQRPL